MNPFEHTSPPEHVERLGQQMRDETELDNLKDDIRRNLKGDEVAMPWRTGRALRSAGMDEDGVPLTPLKALNLHEVVPPEQQKRLAAEFQRVALTDRISEGVLDTAEAAGIPLTEQEQWFEAEQRREAQMQKEFANDNEAEAAKSESD